MQHAFLDNNTIDNGCLPHFSKLLVSEPNRIVFTPSMVRRVIRKSKVKMKDGLDAVPLSPL